MLNPGGPVGNYSQFPAYAKICSGCENKKLCKFTQDALNAEKKMVALEEGDDNPLSAKLNCRYYRTNMVLTSTTSEATQTIQRNPNSTGVGIIDHGITISSKESSNTAGYVQADTGKIK